MFNAILATRDSIYEIKTILVTNKRMSKKVKKENKLVIEQLLYERQNKIKYLNYINVIKIFLLLIVVLVCDF